MYEPPPPRSLNNLTFAIAFHVVVAGIAIWSILLVVLFGDGYGSSVNDLLAGAIFLACVALWLVTPLAMLHWRRSHPRALWLLPVACVAIVAVVVLFAAAVS